MSDIFPATVFELSRMSLPNRLVPLGAPVCICCGSRFLPDVMKGTPCERGSQLTVSGGCEAVLWPTVRCRSCDAVQRQRLDLMVAGRAVDA